MEDEEGAFGFLQLHCIRRVATSRTKEKESNLKYGRVEIINVASGMNQNLISLVEYKSS